MSLQILFASLEQDLSRGLPRNTRSFADACRRQEEIASLGTIDALVKALDPHSALSIVTRRRLIALLDAEAQQTSPSFASGVLVLAFAPMLRGLRKKAGSVRSDPDLDGAILAAFMAAVRTVRPGAYTSLALRWATEREVFTDLRAQRRLGTLAQFDESIHRVSPFHHGRFEEMVEDVVRCLASDGSALMLDVFIATRAHDESLREYVERTSRNPRERLARYKQLYRARRRFERQLRKHLPKRAA